MPIRATDLASLIETHAGPLQVWASGRCEHAEDVVQEAFCQLAQLSVPPERPVAWLYAVCRNLASKSRLAGLRRRRREMALAPREATFDDPREELEGQEAIEALSQIAPELREVVVARIWGQLTLEEVARLCEVSTSTAFRRYEAALAQLRDILAPETTRPQP